MKIFILIPIFLWFTLLSSCTLVSEIPDSEINARWRWVDWKWAIEDKDGKVIISTNQFQDHCYEYSEWRCFVEKNSKYGYLDTHWTLVIPYIYDEAHNFSDGLASVKKEGKRYFINKDGTIVLDFEWKDYEWDLYFFNWALIVRKINKSSDSDKFGVINKNGELIVPIEYISQWTQYYSWNTYVNNTFVQWKVLVITWSTRQWNVKRGSLFPDGTVEWNK